jgi:hypothetical protein
MKMYPGVYFLEGKLVTVAEVWVTTKYTQPPRKLTFFSLSLLHEVGAKSLVLGLKVTPKPSQTFHKVNHKLECFMVTLTA